MTFKSIKLKLNFAYYCLSWSDFYSHCRTLLRNNNIGFTLTFNKELCKFIIRVASWTPWRQNLLSLWLSLPHHTGKINIKFWIVSTCYYIGILRLHQWTVPAMFWVLLYCTGEVQCALSDTPDQVRNSNLLLTSDCDTVLICGYQRSSETLVIAFNII